MDTGSLKEYIFENKKIEFVLEKIGCKSIKFHPNKNFYSCSNYNGDNTGAVNVSNDKYLMVRNWTRQNEFDEVSDIITLTQYNKQCSFVDAIKYLHEILDIEYSFYKKTKKKSKRFDPLSIFKNALCVGKRGCVDVDDVHAIDEEAINDYIPLLYIGWFREGIMPWAAKKFGLAYSYKHKRVVVPLRYWMDGSLLGFNQRTTVNNYEEFGIRKYFLTPSYQKSLNLYGLWENREEIEQKRYVVICESEKSVLKRYSRNDGTCVALQGKTLSDEQKRIILGLDVDEVIIALDNDVDIEEVRHICEKFYHIRKVSYVKDSWDLLGEKDSPMDAENKVYNFLLKYRVAYDAKEHHKYIKSLKL